MSSVFFYRLALWLRPYGFYNARKRVDYDRRDNQYECILKVVWYPATAGGLRLAGVLWCGTGVSPVFIGPTGSTI